MHQVFNTQRYLKYCYAFRCLNASLSLSSSSSPPPSWSSSVVQSYNKRTPWWWLLLLLLLLLLLCIEASKHVGVLRYNWVINTLCTCWLYAVNTAYCTVSTGSSNQQLASRTVTFTVHTACIPAPHSHSHHYQCRTPFAAVHTIVLLMMGIMMPETCWDNLIINIRLVASCWSLSLFTLRFSWCTVTRA